MGASLHNVFHIVLQCNSNRVKTVRQVVLSGGFRRNPPEIVKLVLKHMLHLVEAMRYVNWCSEIGASCLECVQNSSQLRKALCPSLVAITVAVSKGTTKS